MQQPDTRSQPQYGARAILHAVEPHGTRPLTRVDKRGRAETADGTAWIQIGLQLQRNTDRIRSARFQAGGPPALTAAGSVLTRLLEGMRLREARHVRAADLDTLLGGIPDHRRPLLQLAIEGLQCAMARHRSRKRVRRHPRPPARGPARLGPGSGGRALRQLVIALSP